MKILCYFLQGTRTSQILEPWNQSPQATKETICARTNQVAKEDCQGIS